MEDDNPFIEDLRTADTSLNSLDRYKALTRLGTALQQRIARARQFGTCTSAENPYLVDALKKAVMVGECLVRLGTVDFTGTSNNSTRAILTQDYGTFLDKFLTMFGEFFTPEEAAKMPPDLREEAGAVHMLLTARQASNNALFQQLLKHVGLEGQGSGQAVVHNTSIYPANHPPKPMPTKAHKTEAQKAFEQGLDISLFCAVVVGASILLLKGLRQGLRGNGVDVYMR